MTVQFGRQARVVAGGLEIASEGNEGLRVVLRVERKLPRRDPNGQDIVKASCTATVQVFNLNESSRAELDDRVQTSPARYIAQAGDTVAKIATQTERSRSQILAANPALAASGGVITPGQVVLIPPKPGKVGEVQRLVVEAGYAESLATIFVGDRALITHQHVGVDWVTRIEAEDGARAIDETLTRSWAPRTTALAIAKDAVRGSKFLVPRHQDGTMFGTNIEQSLAARAYAKGFAWSGKRGDLLARAFADSGLTMTVQDCTLLAFRRGEAATTSTEVISAETGLAESPERVRDPKRPNKVIFKARTLLNPGLFPGRRVLLQSRQERGVYRVLDLVHEGDTHGGNASWTTEVEIEQIVGLQGQLTADDLARLQGPSGQGALA